MKRALLFAAGLAALLCAGPLAQAQNYPNRPVTFVIGFSPGGPSDVMSRIITRRLEQELKQPFVIENRPGAGGSIAAAGVARAAADGYTVMLGTEAALCVNPLLQKNVGYDSERDFEYVSMIGVQPNVLYVHPSVAAKTFQELVALVKANPGKFNFGSGGLGTTAHLAGEQLKTQAGLDMTHVPFRGTGPAVATVVSGHIQMAFSAPSPLMGHIQGGAVRPLAVTTLKRSGALPDVPTVHESGYPNFDSKNWHGLVAPAGTPKEIVAALRRALMATLEDPEVKRQLNELGVDVGHSTPEEFRAMVKAEIPMFAETIKQAGIKME
jgi:tripartite-type tricarboxylate transporter receptor subunit TctC